MELQDVNSLCAYNTLSCIVLLDWTMDMFSEFNSTIPALKLKRPVLVVLVYIQYNQIG